LLFLAAAVILFASGCAYAGITEGLIYDETDNTYAAGDEDLTELAGIMYFKKRYLPETVGSLLAVMEYDVPCTGAQLMQKLQLKSGEHFRKLYLLPALERSLITMSIPDKPTSRNQSYIRK